MRKVLLAAIGVAAISQADHASAATVFKNEINQTALNVAGSSNFGATLSDVFGPFSITFEFDVLETSLASSSITTQILGDNDIDFTSVFLDGFAFTPGGVDPADETFFLTLAGPLSVGRHVITVNGSTASGDGAFGGNINLNAVAAVPEPGTWAMMLLGFGAIGFSMRRGRRVKAIPQIA